MQGLKTTFLTKEEMDEGRGGKRFEKKGNIKAIPGTKQSGTVLVRRRGKDASLKKKPAVQVFLEKSGIIRLRWSSAQVVKRGPFPKHQFKSPERTESVASDKIERRIKAGPALYFWGTDRL